MKTTKCCAGNRARRVMKYFLYLLIAIASFGVFSGSSEPVVPWLSGTSVEAFLNILHCGNSIVFNLSVGFLMSLLVWFLVSYIPEKNRRAILRNNLTQSYQLFKEDVIQILLDATGKGYGADCAKKLCDYQEFQKYFSENESEKWYAALNGLQDEKCRLNDVIVEIEMLSNEVAYVLNNAVVSDPQAHAFFKRLLVHVHKLRNLSVCQGDPVKYLGIFLWCILARWSEVKGQLQDDAIQDMIEKL